MTRQLAKAFSALRNWIYHPPASKGQSVVVRVTVNRDGHPLSGVARVTIRGVRWHAALRWERTP